MAGTYDNTACPLYGTRYCELLNMGGCKECTVPETKDIEYIKKSIDFTASSLPENGFADLFDTDECALCVDTPKGKRACYAIVDIGNPEPKHEKRSSLGVRMTAQAGSMVPVQAACCARCRNNILKAEYLPVLGGVGVVALGLLLTSIRPVHDLLAAKGQMAPFLVFIAFVFAGMLFCRLLRMRLLKKYRYFTRLNVFEIPLLSNLPAYGWFEINGGYEKKGVTHFMFSQKPLTKGLFTGTFKTKQDA